MVRVALFGRRWWLVVVLSILTVGFYWYYWTFRAFAEVREDDHPEFPAPALPVVAMGFVFAGALYLQFRPPVPVAVDAFLKDVPTAAATVIMCFYATQAARRLAPIAAAERALAGLLIAAPAAYLVALTALYVVSELRALDGWTLGAFAALVVLMVGGILAWTAAMQILLNRYWLGRSNSAERPQPAARASTRPA